MFIAFAVVVGGGGDGGGVGGGDVLLVYLFQCYHFSIVVVAAAVDVAAAFGCHTVAAAFTYSNYSPSTMNQQMRSNRNWQ